MKIPLPEMTEGFFYPQNGGILIAKLNLLSRYCCPNSHLLSAIRDRFGWK